MQLSWGYDGDTKLTFVPSPPSTHRNSVLSCFTLVLLPFLGGISLEGLCILVVFCTYNIMNDQQTDMI